LNQFIELAKKSIDAYIKEGKVLDAPKEIPAEMKKRAGVFICIKKQGALRGCIGTFAPTTENIASEIIRNSIEAATSDPRFLRVSKDELSELDVSVDVLTEPEPVADIKELDAKKFGVIVKSGARRGLLLPDLEGVDTPQQQIEICRQKGGISKNEPVELFKFQVMRYTEEK